MWFCTLRGHMLSPSEWLDLHWDVYVLDDRFNFTRNFLPPYAYFLASLYNTSLHQGHRYGESHSDVDVSSIKYAFYSGLCFFILPTPLDIVEGLRVHHDDTDSKLIWRMSHSGWCDHHSILICLRWTVNLPSAMVMFTSKIFCKIEIVAVSFVFDKYCQIMD